MMRFLIVVLILAFLFVPVAISEEQYSYISAGDYGYPIGWLFNLIGYWNYDLTLNDEPLFDADAEDYLMQYQIGNALDPSGEFDFETLYCIFQMPFDDRSNVVVWVPMHGGKKHHRDQYCSKMIEPRQMPIACAENLGFTHCGKCGIH